MSLHLKELNITQSAEKITYHLFMFFSGSNDTMNTKHPVIYIYIYIKYFNNGKGKIM